MGKVRREDGSLWANFTLRTQDDQTMICYCSSPNNYAAGRRGDWQLSHGAPVFTEGVWFNVMIWTGRATDMRPYTQRQFEPNRSAQQWIDLLLIVREQSGDSLWPRGR